MTATGQRGEIWWHVHHDVLAEPLTEPVEARREHIRAVKPEAERETRLRLLRPVRGPLPPAVVRARAELARARAKRARAGAECARASAEWDRANAEWDRARAKWTRAMRSPEMSALHARECPGCPWDGETIFPEEAEP